MHISTIFLKIEAKFPTHVNANLISYPTAPVNFDKPVFALEHEAVIAAYYVVKIYSL